MIVQELIRILGTDTVLTGADLADRFYHIWKMDEPLQAKAVVLPRSTEDVSKAMSLCNQYKQPVVVHGGLTNLVGSTETSAEDVVISLEKMNRITEVDTQSRTMTVEAGVILENIQQSANEANLLFPLNFGAKGSAQIGGVISTNAGGLRVLRYGMTRNLTLGLEVVLADGTIISSMKKIIKDNSAYDLKHMFIGSEGTLGIVTKAILKLSEAPKSRTSAFVAFNEYNKVVDFLKYMDKGLAGMLSGYELIWGQTYEVMTSPPALAKPPIPHGHKYYVLVESLGSNQDYDQQRFRQLMEHAMEQEIILDASLADNESDLTWFWKIREDVHVIDTQCNHSQHFDISLPIPMIGDYIDQTTEQLYAIAEVEKVFPFGHVADGNIHFIIGKSVQTQEVINQVNDTIYTPLQSKGGSVSAEHGIGVHKKTYLNLCRTAEEINLMRKWKSMMDPNDILNRGKVL